MTRVHGLLGLARRAGGLVAGTEAVREAIRAGEARVVLVATDIADAQRAKLARTLASRPVPRATLGDRAALGAAVGRAPVSALAVTNAPLAARVVAELGDAVTRLGVAGEAAVAAAEG